MKAIAIFFLLACVATNAQTAHGDEWKTCNMPRYSIMYPVSWTLDTTMKNFADLMIMSALASDTDKFS